MSLLAASALVTVGLVLTTRTASAVPLNDCQNRDNGDPMVAAVQVDPSVVDVRQNPQTVTITVQATDTGGPGAASGLRKQGDVYVMHAGSESDAQFADLTREGDVYVAKLRFPRGADPGTWGIHIDLFDRAGNDSRISPEDLEASGLTSTIDVVSFADTTHPRLVRFAFRPQHVDTRTGPKVITFTAKVTDRRSGVDAVSVLAQRRTGHSRTLDARLARVKSQPNVYRGRVIVPRYIAGGRWGVTSVSMRDRVGNSAELNYAELGKAGFMRNFSIRSRTDDGEPRMTAFSRTPAQLDVREADGKISITVKATDADSGVASVWVEWMYPGYDPYTVGASAVLHRVSGSARDGTWQGTATIQRCKPATTLRFNAQVYVKDRVGRLRSREVLTASTVGLLYGDHTFEHFHAGASSGLIRVDFDEPVSGLTDPSATIRQGTDPRDETPDPLVAGSWACSSTGASTDCKTGPVTEATFTPLGDLPPGEYYVTLNPEHSLGVRDLAGNAPRRATDELTVS
jgi:hypothetical protein